MTAWVLEHVANPSVLRLHVTEALTDRTIETCPPGKPPPQLEPLLGVDGVRSIDIHRYVVRANLTPEVDRGAATTAVTAVLRAQWGDAAPLLVEELPRAFEATHQGPRVVAESLEMARAAQEPMLEALLATDGVAEAIAGDGMVLVRLGRLFRWENAEPAVVEALG